jgi:hypothetical protein
MVLAMFILAVMHVPFPLLVLAFLVSAPIVSLAIWRHRRSPIGD